MSNNNTQTQPSQKFHMIKIDMDVMAQLMSLTLPVWVNDMQGRVNYALSEYTKDQEAKRQDN